MFVEHCSDELRPVLEGQREGWIGTADVQGECTGSEEGLATMPVVAAARYTSRQWVVKLVQGDARQMLEVGADGELERNEWETCE